MTDHTGRLVLAPLALVAVVACTGPTDDEVLADWCERAEAFAEVADGFIDVDDPDEAQVAAFTRRSEELYADPVPAELADDIALLRGDEPLPDDDEAALAAASAAGGRVGTFAEQRCGVSLDG